MSAVSGRSISYSIAGTRVLRDVDVEVGEGEMFGIVGPNGSGKSTLLRVLGGLATPESGEVRLNGRQVRGMRPGAIARTLALVEQRAVPNAELSVREVICLGRIPYTSALRGLRARDMEIVERAAAQTGVGELMERSFSTLSGGEQQRVHIARAFAQDTPLLYLDEPTNHLDIAHQLAILDLAAAAGRTNVVVLHDLNLASMYCDRILMLEQGRVFAVGTPAEVLNPGWISEVFDVTSRVHNAGTDPYIQFLRRTR
ncbi:ABC transporter ATP-binding protein [Corynebacterium pacaense]|uniref:ABC transporter ATP-binding protein n=1 Tax=Corynebacterium pacaense TaxID=1816684 RepID=UPI0009B9BE2E|nr:ABC transporter ATP-binding protein [Corynebacterium pacaense]